MRGDTAEAAAPRRGLAGVPIPRQPGPEVAKEDGDPTLDRVLEAARRAQPALCGWPEARVDRLVDALADVVVENSAVLATATVAETGLGNVPDKTAKNEFAARAVADSMRGQPAYGVLHVDEPRGTMEFARPVGVVLGLMPVTNPVATLVFTTLIALKARNALVVRPHRRAGGVSARTVELLRAALAASGAPPDLLQVVRPVDRAQTQYLLHDRRVDVVIATGGAGLVEAAQASGKPTLAAGAGNAPAWIAADADVEQAAAAVVRSKAFDHGVICGSEQHLVVDRRVRDQVLTAMADTGALVLSRAETEHLTRGLFVDGAVRPNLLGRSAQEIAAEVGIVAGPDTRLLVAPLLPRAVASVWGTERLVPVLALHTVADEDEALDRCQALLRRGGAGHTAAVHTRSRSRALRFTAALPVSRVIVNGPAAHGCIGLGNGLAPSLTLGCGAAGGTSTSDNVTYRHLLDITRIAQPLPPN